MPIPRMKAYDGPALLSYGFRPFFLLGAIYSAMAVLLWLPQFYGELALASLFPPLDWHIHELYFGFLPAIMTGFLFTAVPNWTGRMPIQGLPLLLLLLIWLTGRLAITFSATIGWTAAMATDLLFLASIVLVIGNEIVAGRNWRNLKVLLPLALMLAANAAFHLEVRFDGTSDISRRIAVTAAITLIMLIGGRIVPSFTRNWLVRENPGRLPVPYNRFDNAANFNAIAAMAVWIAMPDSPLTAALMALAALAHIIRLGRWAGYRTLADPLVAILHVGYLFVPTGFALLALTIQFPDIIPPAAGMHALGVGAVGCMTLAVMTRATLGHTGQALRAGPAAMFIFAAILLAVLARIAAAFGIGMQDTLLHVAAFAWFAAYAGFALAFGPALMRRRA